MKSVTRKLTRYTYYFGSIVERDNGYSLEVTHTYDSYQKLGTRRIKELADDFQAQYINISSKEVKAEVALETFIENANITEI